MANYITAVQFTSITGITGAEAGESTEASTTVRDAEIAKAQLEFERETERTWVAADDDYILTQEAVAWLTGHRLAVRKMKLLGETSPVTMHLNEYRRLKALIKKSEDPDMKGQERIFDGLIDTIEVEERYDEA